MIILLCLILFNNSIPYVSAAENKSYYARIMYEQSFLYKSPTDDNSNNNVYFELPKTYFVVLTGSANEDFYSARYLNINGYVKKEHVQATESIPTTPFLDNLNFRVYAELSRNLMSEPNTTSATSKHIANIPLYSKNVTYYGKIVGETLIDGRTDIWYYCKFSANTDYYGYVYSDFCDQFPETLPENVEEVNYISDPFLTVKTEETPKSLPAKSSATSIIVAILTLPALAFFFMIIKGKNILTKQRTKDKEITNY